MSAARDERAASEPKILAFVEELASLYAALWVDGKLDSIREEPDAEDD